MIRFQRLLATRRRFIAIPNPLLTTLNRSKCVRVSITPASNAPADTTYTIVTSPSGGIDYSAGTSALNRIIGNLVDDVSYTLIASSTSISKGSGASSDFYTVTPTSTTPSKTTCTDTTVIIPANYSIGDRIQFVDAARTKAILKNPSTNTVSIQVSPNSLPNNNNNGNWTEVYVLAPGEQITVSADTRQWKARILNNAVVYNQKLICEWEATI